MLSEVFLPLQTSWWGGMLFLMHSTFTPFGLVLFYSHGWERADERSAPLLRNSHGMVWSYLSMAFVAGEMNQWLQMLLQNPWEELIWFMCDCSDVWSHLCLFGIHIHCIFKLASICMNLISIKTSSVTILWVFEIPHFGEQRTGSGRFCFNGGSKKLEEE